MSDTMLRQQLLDNGLELVFNDLSNRYYGNFYQVKIEVVIRIYLSNELLVEFGFSEKEQLQTKNRFGALFEDRQELKRMGVAGPEVSAVCRQMIQQFIDSSLPYMSKDQFPAQLLRKRLLERPSLRSING